MLGPKEKDQAINDAPESLRAQFSVESSDINQIHGSDSVETAEKELEFFFPVQKTLAVIKPNAYDKKGWLWSPIKSTSKIQVICVISEEIMQRIREAGFEVTQQKQQNLSKEMAEAFYSEHKEKEFYDQLVDFMSRLNLDWIWAEIR